ncbi:M1 family metallopeptidase [Pseudoxanthomonas sangjuensis]|uniref:M1 family metallopeptidase n=1 Tax=Pseudoxanthomonas sangjuensis TaxID=1503750 RepID=UPI00139084CC|nr:M1 family metallopeptidase [Pseudoxanthomonas sangjuensis]KAF1715764.1 peptidase M1 [Pseudoxanthomonas sangjuensis]
MRRLPAVLLFAAVASAHAADEQPPLSAQTLSSGGPAAPEQKAVAFDKAELAFKLIPESRRLEGDARLTFVAKRRLQRLVVDLDNNFGISAVEVDGQPVAANHWRNPDGRLAVDLPHPLEAGARTVLRIVYAGSPHRAQRAPWDGGIVWTTAPTGEPWIATAVEGEGCDLFWPCIDQPFGEPGIVEQHVSVPAPLVAAGNGVLLGVDEKDGWRTYHWRAKQPDTYAVALNVGPYELLQADYRSRYGNTIPLRFWYLKGNAAKAKELFAQFPLFLDFYEEKIGPYPFGDEKMGVVETPHLGMEHQTINAYGNGYKKDAYGYDWLLHHEFAHEWFGNQLTNADWNDMWLHEGFGTYMQPLYLQWSRGDMAYMAELMKQRALVKNRFPVVSGHSYNASDVYDADKGPALDLYYKGSLVLHTLRGLIGDEAFFEATRKLVYGRTDPRPGNFMPRYGETKDFVDAVNAQTGKDYGWFFNVYLRSTALPQLLAAREGGKLSLRWKTEGDKPFPMPVQVRVGDRVVDLSMADGRGDVEIADGESWTLDPHSKVLRDAPEIEAFQKDAAERAQAAKK